MTVIDTATMTPVGVNVGPAWDSNNFSRQEWTNSVGNVALSPDGKRAYVTYSVTIAEHGVGGQSSGSFFTTADGTTWMITGGYYAVSVIDTDPASANYNTEIARIIVPAGTQDVAVSGNYLYVTSWDGKTVTVIDTTSNATAGTFTTDQTTGTGRVIHLPNDSYPVSVAAFTRYVTAADGTLYITDYSNNNVYAVTVG